MDTYDRYLNQILREDSLINSRLGWLLGFQGLLFTSLSIITSEGVNPSYEVIVEVLSKSLPILGLIASITTFVALLIANKAYKQLYAQWEKEEIEILPNPFGVQSNTWYGWLAQLLGPSTVITLASVILWAYLICRVI